MIYHHKRYAAQRLWTEFIAYNLASKWTARPNSWPAIGNQHTSLWNRDNQSLFVVLRGEERRTYIELLVCLKRAEGTKRNRESALWTREADVIGYAPDQLLDDHQTATASDDWCPSISRWIIADVGKLSSDGELLRTETRNMTKIDLGGEFEKRKFISTING